MHDIYNVIRISDNIITSGQPTETQLRAAAEKGVQVVINLATLDTQTTLADEAGLVLTLGMAYFHIPLVWGNPTADNFAEFVRVMRENGGKVILIHCVANYRATAFYALYAMQDLSWSETQGDALMARIWHHEVNPVWETFIRCTKDKIKTAK